MFSPADTAVLVLLTGVYTLHPILVESTKVNGSYHYSVILSQAIMQVIKLAFCLALFLHHKLSRSEEPLVSLKPKQFLMMAIPSIIYSISNNVSLITLQLVDAAIYRILTQLRLLAIAILSIFGLKMKISSIQWFALSLVLSGSILAKTTELGCQVMTHHKRSITIGTIVLLVFVVAFLNALAAVATEVALKSTAASFIYQTATLFLWELIFDTLGFIILENHRFADGSVFGGFENPTVWWMMLNHGIQKIAAAVIIKHYDNLIRSMSNSLSILPTALVSQVIFKTHLSIEFYISAIIVCIASVQYIMYLDKTKHKPPTDPEESYQMVHQVEQGDQQDQEVDGTPFPSQHPTTPI